MKMILVRHGQTEWNAQQKYQGHTDVPLNDMGRQQAGRVADYLYDQEGVEGLYGSDLARARETAEIIGRRLDLPVTTDTRLRELNFGVWEGLTFSEVYRDYREEFDNWFHHTEGFKVPGGESFQELLNRSLQALREIAVRHSGTVVVATHGGVIMALLYHLNGALDLWQAGVKPGSISYFEFSQGEIQAGEVGVSLS
jgi:alpha-ribazole phosphatase